MKKGIIMEIRRSKMIMLTSDGQFLQIPHKEGCQPGQEIKFSIPRTPMLRMTSSFAAAVVFFLVLFSAMSGIWGGDRAVAAYVSIDINPSVELGVNKQEHVVSARGLNADGETLLQGISYQGKPIADVTRSLVEKANEKGYLAAAGGDVLVVSAELNGQNKIDEQKMNAAVTAMIRQVIQQQHLPDTIHVLALIAPPDAREKADSEGLSMGRYSIYLTAKQNNTPIPIAEIRKDSLTALTEKFGGIKSMLDLKNPQTKEALNQWKQNDKEEDHPGTSEDSSKKKTDGTKRVSPTAPAPASLEQDQHKNEDNNGNEKEHSSAAQQSKALELQKHAKEIQMEAKKKLDEEYKKQLENQNNKLKDNQEKQQKEKQGQENPFLHIQNPFFPNLDKSINDRLNQDSSAAKQQSEKNKKGTVSEKKDSNHENNQSSNTGKEDKGEEDD